MSRSIVRLASVSSTNDAAGELARAGAPAGTVVTAAEQTAGRGTKGRAWHSPPGVGLYVSIILRPPLDALPLLPLAAGLAAGDAAGLASGAAVGLKWPNDVLWEGRKLGGVLCESGFSGGDFEFAVAGIGLNVDQEEADFPPGLRGSAASLRMAAGRPIDREALLEALLASLEEWTERLSAGESAAVAAAFTVRAVHRPGDVLTLDTGAGPFTARYEGIGADGALVVATAAGTRRLLSAEIIKVR
jgi:BirA family biotin operon repressor/biotin-[acetyl-CoA-carboxylase] ligase